jgi:cobalamin-dependent methionine synthase I
MDRWTDFQLDVKPEDVLRGVGLNRMDSSRKFRLLESKTEIALQTALEKIQPIALLRKIRVQEVNTHQVCLEDGSVFSNRELSHLLTGAEHIVVAICSIGAILEDYSTSFMKSDMLLALALDGLGNAAVENIVQQVCKRLDEESDSANRQTTSPICPGIQGWSVDIGQPQLFSLVDAGKAGITLTDGMMMHPKKSISFIIGIGQDLIQQNVCILCSLNSGCHFHHG